MQIQLVFPILLVILDGCAALVYLFTGGWWHFVYWGSACLLSLALVMMK